MHTYFTASQNLKIMNSYLIFLYFIYALKRVKRWYFNIQGLRYNRIVFSSFSLHRYFHSKPQHLASTFWDSLLPGLWIITVRVVVLSWLFYNFRTGNMPPLASSSLHGTGKGSCSDFTHSFHTVRFGVIMRSAIFLDVPECSVEEMLYFSVILFKE
jgi:hypothetical protein